MFAEDLCGKCPTVGKVPVERRLSHAGPASDLAHGDVGGVGEQLAGGDQNRLPIAQCIFTQLVRGHGHPRGSVCKEAIVVNRTR